MAKKRGPKLIQIWTDREVAFQIANFLKQNIKTQISIFNFIGQSFINDARDGGNYTDRTGNLRSSIGYAVVVNGKIQNSVFEGESEGVGAGRSLVQSVMKGQGIELIVTAGMDYAGYVEAKGYNVLTLFAPEKSKLAKDFKIFLDKIK